MNNKWLVMSLMSAFIVLEFILFDKTIAGGGVYDVIIVYFVVLNNLVLLDIFRRFNK